MLLQPRLFQFCFLYCFYMLPCILVNKDFQLSHCRVHVVFCVRNSIKARGWLEQPRTTKEIFHGRHWRYWTTMTTSTTTTTINTSLCVLHSHRLITRFQQPMLTRSPPPHQIVWCCATKSEVQIKHRSWAVCCVEKILNSRPRGLGLSEVVRNIYVI